jgi:hypothetical protein
MSTFTIDSENNITALAGPATGTDESQSFSSPKELAKLTAEWPASRLVGTWNSFAGVAPFDELKQSGGDPDLDGYPAPFPGRRATGGTCRAQQGKVEEGPGESRPARVGAKGRNRSSRKQEGRGHRDDEARQGRDASRDHGNHGLAGAHGAGLRQHPGQQGRGEDRILEERRRGAQLPHREVKLPAKSPLQTPLPVPAGAAFLLRVTGHVGAQTRPVASFRRVAGTPRSLTLAVFREQSPPL